MVDPNGLIATSSYDAFGRLTETTPPGQPTRSTRYFLCGAVTCPAGAEYVVSRYAAGAPETHSYFDHLGREIQSSVRDFADTGFIDSAVAYHIRGLKTFESQPHDALAGESGAIGTRYLSYDALGRLTAKEQDQANGTILSTTYNHQG